MKIPEVPKHPSITLEQALIDLLNSMASEETAISKLINSEAKKTSAFAGDNKDFPAVPSKEEIIQHCQSINNIVNSILMKEWLLLRKLETTLYSSDRLNFKLAED